MAGRVTAPFGEWVSPISAAEIARARTRVAFPVLGAGATWWQETPPGEGGRTTVIRRAADGACVPVIPDGYDARTRVHEYGGRSYLPIPARTGDGWSLVFANHADQRLFLLRGNENAPPSPLTPVPPVEAGLRYADFALSPDGMQVWCVREAHVPGRAPERAVVAVPLDGSGAERPAAVREVATGGDFLAFPTPSPDGRHLAWISWQRPHMPWEASELRVARIDGRGPVAGRRLLGGPAESVLAPLWNDATSLSVVSDRSGWWNLYRVALDGQVDCLCKLDEEFAEPLWELGGRPFAALPGGRFAVLHGRGTLRLGVLDPATGRLTDVPSPYTSFAPAVSAAGHSVCGVARGPALPDAVLVFDLAGGGAEVVRSEHVEARHTPYLPSAEPVEFTGDDGEPVHAFVHPPANPDFQAPPGELPPYVVWVHGGPTGHETGAFDIGKAYFTSRGIGVLDVNYGGSSGYGRTYRDRLRGNWGVTDAADAVAAARALAAQGRADPGRLAIRGASSGGWTALVAVTSRGGRPVFAAATSYFGVTDLVSLAATTHDFEAGYFDSLVGPLPESLAVYRERSPLGHVSSSTCPVLLLQGLRDPVVPPAQALAMLAELAGHGVDHTYFAFGDESHGFRRPATIRACFEAELAFYGRVLGFDSAGHERRGQGSRKTSPART